MSWLRLGVVAFCFGALLYTVTTAGTSTGPLEGFASGPEGMFSFAFWMAKMLGYAFLVAVGSVTLWFVCSALNVGTDVISKITTGLRTFYQDMAGSPTKANPLQDVIARENGKDVTVMDLLQRFSSDIQSLQEKTSHIEPPPPPKTREEELEEQLAEAKALLAKQPKDPSGLSGAVPGVSGADS